MSAGISAVHVPYKGSAPALTDLIGGQITFMFDSMPSSLPMVKAGKKGLPDGMKVDVLGNIFATGPGGVFVFSPEGRHLGTINTGEPTANCGWGDNGSVLYITANHYLCRIQTKTRGKL